jgi:hypothetical protein
MGGGVTWRDPLNGLNGDGKWKRIAGAIRIDWTSSASYDTWTWPPPAAPKQGTAYVEGEGTFPLSASKL